MGLKIKCLCLLAAAINSLPLAGSTGLCEVSFSPMITMKKVFKQFRSGPSSHITHEAKNFKKQYGVLIVHKGTKVFQ